MVKGDLADREALSRAVQGCSVVFHCAVDRSNRESNLTAIQTLIELCIRHRARLVHVSTFGIYEPLPEGDLTEDMEPIHSGIPYSELKLDVEEAVLAAVGAGNLDATIVLPTIVYGPYGKSWTILPATQIASGTVVLPANGEGYCNAVYVDDVCQAIIRAAVVPAARGRRYLVSGPEPVTWRTFYQKIADALERPGPQAISNADFGRLTSSPANTVKQLLAEPRSITRWAPARTLASYAKLALSKSAKAKLRELYRIYGQYAPKPVYTPPPQQVALFSTKCRVVIDRARTELGYRPEYDFDYGIRLTSEWLAWAMGSNLKVR